MARTRRTQGAPSPAGDPGGTDAPAAVEPLVAEGAAGTESVEEWLDWLLFKCKFDSGRHFFIFGGHGEHDSTLHLHFKI